MKELNSTLKKFFDLKILAFLAVFLLMAIPDAQASHIRFSNITWKSEGGNTVTFTIQYAQAGSNSLGSPFSISFRPGDGSSRTATGTVTAVDPCNNYWFAETTYTHTYANPGNYIAEWSSCCRIGGLQNNANGSIRNESIVNVGTGNSSPVSSVPAILTLQQGLNPATFQMPAADPDGDNLNFRLATSSEYGGTSQPPNLSISSSGLISFNTAATSVGQLYNVAIAIEDLDGGGNVKSKIIVDYIIKIVAQTTNGPQFSSVTPDQDFLLDIECNQTLTFDVGGTGDGSITLIGIGVPQTATFNPVLPLTGNGTVASSFSWTPGAADIGVTLISLILSDNDDCLQTIRSFSIQVLDNQNDGDGDGFGTCTDCDDTNAAINPDAQEICDGIDNNCNGQIDEGFDMDGDGFSTCNGDCDDNDPTVYPNAPELCDGKDNDCDGIVETSTPYTITSSDLTGMITSCNSNRPYGYGQIGFTWTSTNNQTPTSVSVEFLVGVDCNNTGTTRTTQLNGQAQTATFTSDDANCTCTEVTYMVSLALDPADYVPGGTNTFLIDGSYYLGFQSVGGVYARVCVEYGSDPCADETDPPILICPSTQYLTVDSYCNASLPDYTSQATVMDECDDNPTVSQYPTPGTTLSGTGNTSVTLIATDALGNSTSCNFTVTTQDMTPPSVTCKSPTVYLEPNGYYTLLDTDVLDFANSSDNCNFHVSHIGPAAVSCDDFDTTVPTTVTVSDASGNTAQCTAYVYVDKGTALPAGWGNTNIGGATGSAVYDPCEEVYCVESNGISFPLEDKIHLAHQYLCASPNMEIIARVVSVSDIHGFGGIMIRESLDAGAKKVAMKTQLNGTFYVQRDVRTVTDGFSSSNQTFRPGVNWLRIVRNGNQFIMYTRRDNTGWQFMGFAIVQMNSCVYIGLFAEGDNDVDITTACFDNVSVTGGSLQPIVDGEDTPWNAETTRATEFSIFPNPATNEVNIDLSQFEDNTFTMKVYNNMGQLVFRKEYLYLENYLEQLDISQYQDGIYLINVELDDGTILSKKLVVYKK